MKTSPSRIGASVWDFVGALEWGTDDPPDQDPTIVAALALAKSARAMRDLETLYPHFFKVANRLIFFPAIERAWRDLLHVRSRLGVEIMMYDIEREVTLTRYGRIVRKGDPEAAVYSKGRRENETD